MLAQPRLAAALLITGLTVTACSSVTAASKSLRPTPTVSTPSAVPVATATPVAVPPGPYAVVTTNSLRQGSTYDVLLIDLAGQIVARVTAKLPLLKPNQTINPPLVSASNNLVYYLDGDTDIRSLAPAGGTALTKTIAAGSSSILGFAVSPDDQKIAVAVINQASDPTKDAGRGYVEDLAESSNHVELFHNTFIDALRWPLGWHGASIIDNVTLTCPGGISGYNSSGCGTSYHVVDSASGSRRAAVCEQPATSPSGVNIVTSPNGLPVDGGTVCVKAEYYFGPQSNDVELLSVDWSGRVTIFANGDKNNGQLPFGSCSLAPGGAQMACTDATSQALTIVAPGRPPHSLGRRYNVLGWIDATHLLVDIDSNTLAVVDTGTAQAVDIVVANADKVQMAGTEPGAL